MYLRGHASTSRARDRIHVLGMDSTDGGSFIDRYIGAK
jgi:hypothetical protein